ncbi:hypothetical protein DVH24_035860 [Malus domestica]|uniref:Uncharacterized protein n=1 Tax=Malus domestica TaxID=3750 RepID=A0A498JUI0_MALDO|nr:hypothetical protein DVH24_035860 [Malus domestica]
MEVEQKQAQVIEHFGSSLVSLIVQLTSHSSLFAFSEILAFPNVLESLETIKDSSSHSLK